MSSRYAILVGLCFCLSVCVGSIDVRASGQAPGDPNTAGAVRLSNFVKGNILKSAEQMPEADYAFRPTPDVRTFGEILGHVANTNYQYCSQAAGEANPSKVDIEKTVTTKVALSSALSQSFAYCDKVLGGMTDRTASELVPNNKTEASRLSVISVNTAHNFEHYGNLITYLRLKGMVPPSSQPKP